MDRTDQAAPDREDPPIEAVVADLTRLYTDLWWSCTTDFPALSPIYTLREKLRRETRLERFLAMSIDEASQASNDGAGRSGARDRLTASTRDFARSALGFEDRQLDVIENGGFTDASIDFARMARGFDPCVRGEDIYQAGRNVWSMNLFQSLLGLPVRVTPAIFAYSMLYPYTDNILDNPTLSVEQKLDFNRHFAVRLAGEVIQPANPDEDRIFTLIAIVEGQYERAAFPQVYASLQAIHRAQTRSLELLRPQASPFEVDVLDIGFEKGGAATLADGYLVAGQLSPAQREFFFGYGVFTQLMDDQEDVHKDLRDGVLTVFSQTAPGWKLDAITNRLFHLAGHLTDRMGIFSAPGIDSTRELVGKGIDLLLIDAAGRAGRLYSRPYLRALEAYLPFRFSFLDRQRKKLNRCNLTLSRLTDVFSKT